MYIMRRFSFVVILALLLLLPSMAMGQSQQVIINRLNTTNFPNVEVSFRLTNGQSAVSGLTVGDVSVQEDGVPVPQASMTLNSDNDAPMTVAFVIDKGQYTSFTAFVEEIGSTMTLLRGSFRDGTDTVAVYMREGNVTTPLVSPTQSFDQLSTWVEDSVVRGNPPFDTDQNARTDSFQGIIDVLNILDQNGNVDAGPTAIVWFARQISSDSSDASLTNLSTLANQLNVPVHLVHTIVDPGTFQGDLFNRMQSAAALTGGQYYLLQNNGDNAPSINALYAPLNNNRLRYELAYTSQNSSSSERNVSLTAASATANANYTVNVQAPTVTMTFPNLGGTVLDRRVTVDIDEEAQQVTKTYGVSSTTVTGAVNFPDGIQRQILSATLYVDETAVQTLTSPEPSYFEFVWSVDSFTERGDFSRNLRIDVTDSLGGVYSSPSQAIIVRLNFPEDLPTEFNIVENQCELDPNSSACLQETARLWIPVAASAVLLLVAIILAWRLRQTEAMLNMRDAVTNVGAAVGTMVGQVRSTLVGRDSGMSMPAQGSLYRLSVVKGPPGDLSGQAPQMQIDISNHMLSIGRASAQNDLRFYGSNAVSSVSRQHCIIRYDQTQNRFFIEDKDSAAGTIVNGQQYRGQEVELTDGAVIILGEEDNNGVTLRFEVTANGYVPSAPLPTTGNFEAIQKTSVGGVQYGGHTTGEIPVPGFGGDDGSTLVQTPDYGQSPEPTPPPAAAPSSRVVSNFSGGAPSSQPGQPYMPPASSGGAPSSRSQRPDFGTRDNTQAGHPKHHSEWTDGTGEQQAPPPPQRSERPTRESGRGGRSKGNSDWMNKLK